MPSASPAMLTIPGEAPPPSGIVFRGFPGAPKPTRLASLDIFRGLTIALMVLVNNPGGPAYGPLQHAKWHGWTITDLVFPFFLFIVGVAIPFSLSRRGEDATRGELLGRIWMRALALFMLGQLLAAINLPLPSRDLPAGFAFTKAMRWFGFTFSYLAIIALMVPWKSRRIATWLPLFIAIIFYGYAVAMHFVREHAIGAGWPEKTFGAGVFNPDQLRIPGVLQRIAICYAIAATIALFTGWRTVLVSILILCAGYSALMLRMPFGDHTVGSLTMEQNFARAIDVFILQRGRNNHAYSAYPDPEGIVSTLPAIATALCGVLAGYWLRSSRTPAERCAGLLAVGGPVAILGIVLDGALMPINKMIWTPSYVALSAGLAMLVLGTIFWLADVQGRRAWAWPFKVMGMNAIAAFVASSLVLRLARLFPVFPLKDDKTGAITTAINQRLTAGLSNAELWLQQNIPTLATIDTRENASLLYALAFLGVIFLITWVLYVCRVFVKV